MRSEGRRTTQEKPPIKTSPYRSDWSLYTTAAATALLWTALILASLAWDAHNMRDGTRRVIISETRSTFNKDRSLRLWAASHGGVYVPVTEHTTPNPNLSHMPERDITTPSGRTLTLMNPAYMLRQIMEDYENEYGISGRLTSLSPLRKENAPDEWETKALISFEKGAKEAFEFTEIDGKPYLRLMRPMPITERCLKCHINQGYMPGDVRGGVGISVPLSEHMAMERDHIMSMGRTLLGIWVMGMGGIGYGFVRLRRNRARRKKAEEQLRQSLSEKEMLIKEIHHRVKNNLMVIQSLLRLQSGHVTDSADRELFEESESRVRAMGLIHERLYRSGDLSTIDLPEYMNSLAVQLFKNYRLEHSRVDLRVDADEVTMDIDTIIPCGLIVNELLSNSLKYAFPEGVNGFIEVKLKHNMDGSCTLGVKDNGVGLPEGLDIYKTNSLGMQIVTALCRQLEAELEVNRQGGTEFRVNFRAPDRRQDSRGPKDTWAAT